MAKRPLVYPGLGLNGRLGNQLWQIASTVGMARTRGYKPLFPVEWPYRPYFSVPDQWFGPIQPRDTQASTLATRIDPRARAYLQDFSLWANAATEIWSAFEPSKLALEVVTDQWEQLAHLPLPLTSVHIRRGDYATNPNGTINSLPPGWYLDALAEAGNAFGSTVAFSDDPQWCEETFGDRFDFYYRGIPRPKEQDADYLTAPVLDWIDLFLMAECQHHVISNSSYSWWGAWLSGDQHPVYPGSWYGEQLAYIDWRTMIPSGWVEVPVEE